MNDDTLEAVKQETKLDRRREDAFRILTDDILLDRKNQRRLSYMKIGIFLVGLVIFTYAKSMGLGPFSKGIAIPSGEKYVSVVRITGSINAGAPASAEIIESQLYKAFFDKKSEGVVLLINSPGGTAVQGLLLHDLIEEYKNETKKKVLAFGEDYLTSGAYMAALAADVIYATPSTITGSIGVKQDHFNATDLLEKIGVRANTIHSGEFKNRMSMYKELNESDIKKANEITHGIHEQFIEMVKASRKGKISAEPMIYSGDFWLGSEAHALGLIDGVSSINKAIKTEFGAKYKIDYSDRSTVGGLRKLVASADKTLLTELLFQISTPD